MEFTEHEYEGNTFFSTAPPKATAQLKEELKELAPQVRQIAEVFALVKIKKQIPAELQHAAKVMTEKGYLRFSDRANRFMYTDKGKTFHKSMKRFGH